MPGPTVTLKIDEAKLAEVRETLRGVPRGMPRALAAAINRTLSTGRTRIKRKLAGILNLKQSVILDGSEVRKAKQSSLEGHIVFRRKPIPLIAYGATETGGSLGRDASGRFRATGGGVSVSVHKGGDSETHPHWFIATMASGHQGVFDRRKVGGGAGVDGRSGRLPVDEKYGPTIVGTLAGRPGLLEEATGDLDEVLLKNVDSQVDRLLARRKLSR